VTFNPQNPQQIIFTRYAYVGTQLVEQLQWLDVSTETAVVPLTPPEQPARQASYSPDGAEVAYVQHGDGSAEDLYVAQVQVANASAQLNNARRVATGLIAQPLWSSDGGSLYYIALTNEQFQIWSLTVQRDVDGAETFGRPHQVTTGGSVDATSRPVYMTREQADLVRKWLAEFPT
jgi:Tol biopolymer transport system component